ncbi:protein-ribulosamine 3-kinase [Mytilus galloprovincialis]|uniref:protein-ribulosamine 3-kinase n=1 Tax=Mytilus galloprovincialis TaxID=29158 RepID=A0A8B6BN55_MYTGA|nr:protein-ribulosamine 3-kinase [Mytilus galloprovincialis]
MSDKELKGVIEQELQTKVNIQGSHGGGCINEAVTITTDNGERIFVKINKKSEARAMFDGEFISLDVLHAMDVVRVPKPIKSFLKIGMADIA